MDVNGDLHIIVALRTGERTLVPIEQQTAPCRDSNHVPQLSSSQPSHPKTHWDLEQITSSIPFSITIFLFATICSSIPLKTNLLIQCIP